MGQAQVSLRGRISGMDQRWQAESSRVSRIEGGQSTNGSRARAFGGVAKVNFSGSAKSDLYPGLVGNAKVVKPSELPIMRARDISRHRHSLTQNHKLLTITHNKREKELSTFIINKLLK